MSESDSEAEALRDVLVQAAGYLGKLAANLRVRADRIATREMKNTHSVRKVTNKVLTICDLSMKSLVKVADVVKRAVEKDQNIKEDKPSGGWVKKHKFRSRRIDKSRLQRIGKIMVQIPQEVNLKHFTSCTVNVSRFPKSYFDQYPHHLYKKPIKFSSQKQKTELADICQIRGDSEHSKSVTRRRRTHSSRESSKSRQDGECSDPESNKDHRRGIKTKSKNISYSRHSAEYGKSLDGNEPSDSDPKNIVKSTTEHKSRSNSRNSSEEKELNPLSQSNKNHEIQFTVKNKSHQKSDCEYDYNSEAKSQECVEDIIASKRKAECESYPDESASKNKQTNSKKHCHKKSPLAKSLNLENSSSQSEKLLNDDNRSNAIERKNNIMNFFKIPRKAVPDNNEKSDCTKTREDSVNTNKKMTSESGKLEKSHDQASSCDRNKRTFKRLHLVLSSSDDESEGKPKEANSQGESNYNKEQVSSKNVDDFLQEKDKCSVFSKHIHDSSEIGQQIDRELSKSSIVTNQIIPEPKEKQKDLSFQYIKESEKSKTSLESTKNQEDAKESNNSDTNPPKIFENNGLTEAVLFFPSSNPVKESGQANSTVSNAYERIHKGLKSPKSTQATNNDDTVNCLNEKSNTESEDHNLSMASNNGNGDSVMIVEDDSSHGSKSPDLPKATERENKKLGVEEDLQLSEIPESLKKPASKSLELCIIQEDSSQGMESTDLSKCEHKQGVDENSKLAQISDSLEKPMIKWKDLCDVKEDLSQGTKYTDSAETTDRENELLVDENSKMSQTSDSLKKPMIKCIDLNKLLKSPLKDKTETRKEKRNDGKPLPKNEKATHITISSKSRNKANKSKITHWPSHKDNSNDLVKSFIPKPFSIHIHRLGKYTEGFFEKNQIKKITKYGSVIAQISLSEPVNTAAKSELLNESSDSSHSSTSIKKPTETPSKRKHVIASMKAKRMLLTYSSSSDDDTPKTPQKKPPNDEEMRKKTEENKKKLLRSSSSSSSDADCLPSINKKDKNGSSDEKCSNKNKEKKHRDRSGSKASSISQFDGNDDHVSASASETEV